MLKPTGTIRHCLHCGDEYIVSTGRYKYCTTKCRKTVGHAIMKEHWRNAIKKFTKMKETIGCQICGYHKYGGSLAYHHVGKHTKARRIHGDGWYRGNKKTIAEMEKCIILCNNCHIELHDKMVVAKRSI